MALNEVLSRYEDCLSSPPEQAEGGRRRWALRLLNARQQVAEVIAGHGILSDELESLIGLDDALRVQAQEVVDCLGEETLAAVRKTLCVPVDAWWWRLDEVGAAGWKTQALYYATWAAVAFILSWIVELSRRFISPGPDILSTLLQGAAALLVGGVTIELGRTLLERARRRTSKRAPPVSLLLRLLVFALVFQGAALCVVLAANRVGVAAARDHNPARAIAAYELALRLSPDDPKTLVNLATEYARVGEMDKAQAQLYASIRASGPEDHLMTARAYAALARVLTDRQQAYSLSLSAARSGQYELDNAKAKIAADDVKAIRFALARERARALLALNLLNAAGAQIEEARVVDPQNATLHCLSALLDRAMKKSSEKEEWRKCLPDTTQVDGKLEPEWVLTAESTP